MLIHFTWYIHIAHTASSLDTSSVPKEVQADHESDLSSAISLDDESLSSQQSFKCGCGQCSLSSWLQNGCSSTNEQNVKYPYLDLSRLNHKECRALETKLDVESKKIKKDFSKLVFNTQGSLIHQNVTVEELASCLADLGTYEAVYPNKPVLYHHIDDIYKAKNIYDVFRLLISYRSFFNYHIIEHIIDILGTKEDKANLSTYKEILGVFLKRRVFECPESVCKPLGGDYRTDVVVKIGTSNSETEFSMAEISIYQATISDILGIHLTALLLCNISKGCVQLVFQIPKFIMADGKIFPLNVKQTGALRAKGIIKLRCECFEWECEPQVQFSSSCSLLTCIIFIVLRLRLLRKWCRHNNPIPYSSFLTLFKKPAIQYMVLDQ